MPKFKAVIFDIDGTLTIDISWFYLTEKIGGSLDRSREIFKSWKNRKYSNTEVKVQFMENWCVGKRCTYDNFHKILDEVRLREDAKETVDYLKEKGYKLCMITGSFDMYAKIISEKLGIDDYIAITRLDWDANGNLVDMETAYNDKDQKVNAFKKYCDEHGFEYNECVHVGDSINDQGIFELTGNGIAVRNEFEAKELEAVAWKAVENLAEIKTIL